ncbi:MAG: hypothetical protein E7328_03440 [Clostridiales bacterium]|nr:hypothetical protein [Clostridiales bacterium]
MKIRIFESREECLVAGAWEFMRYALNDPKPVIGCCTGSTTGPIHELVSDMYRKNPFDTSNLYTVNADEWVTPDEADRPLTMRVTMKRELFDALGIDEEHSLIAQSVRSKAEQAAIDFEKRIDALGGVGLQMLGVGPDAHLGFCTAGTPFGSLTHVRAIPEPTVELIYTKYGFPREWGPYCGITMGIKSFMKGKKTLPITVGTSKAEAVEKSILGPVTEEVPASVLQLHPNCVWYMDKLAAEGIIGRVDESMLIK